MTSQQLLKKKLSQSSNSLNLDHLRQYTPLELIGGWLNSFGELFPSHICDTGIGGGGMSDNLTNFFPENMQKKMRINVHISGIF